MKTKIKTERFNNPTDFKDIKEEHPMSSEKSPFQTTVETLVENNIDYKDQYLRLYADFENYKKRIQKEKEELVLNTKTKSLNVVLDLDNDLHIARKSIGESDGINMILNKVNTFLKSQGIEEIQTESYDSDLHEVVSVLETGEEKVIDVVSKGYSINGKPFRYPKIILSK
jgi:molecular chaperone GrpE